MLESNDKSLHIAPNNNSMLANRMEPTSNGIDHEDTIDHHDVASATATTTTTTNDRLTHNPHPHYSINSKHNNNNNNKYNHRGFNHDYQHRFGKQAAGLSSSGLFALSDTGSVDDIERKLNSLISSPTPRCSQHSINNIAACDRATSESGDADVSGLSHSMSFSNGMRTPPPRYAAAAYSNSSSRTSLNAHFPLANSGDFQYSTYVSPFFISSPLYPMSPMSPMSPVSPMSPAPMIRFPRSQASPYGGPPVSLTHPPPLLPYFSTDGSSAFSAAPFSSSPTTSNAPPHNNYDATNNYQRDRTRKSEVIGS